MPFSSTCSASAAAAPTTNKTENMTESNPMTTYDILYLYKWLILIFVSLGIVSAMDVGHGFLYYAPKLVATINGMAATLVVLLMVKILSMVHTTTTSLPATLFLASLIPGTMAGPTAIPEPIDLPPDLPTPLLTSVNFDTGPEPSEGPVFMGGSVLAAVSSAVLL